MGKGKKHRTLLLKEKSETSRTANSSASARNLSKNELEAVIFGCKNHTFAECLNKHMFGLPAEHISYVRNVTPGLMLFLFNYSDRMLHGIFKAVSTGQLNINPYAWTESGGTEQTRYAAQVRVDVQRQCRPLSEKQFKPLIAENYYAVRLFWFELDKEQTKKLINLFLLNPVVEKNPRPPNPPKKSKSGNIFDVLSNSDADEAPNKEFGSDLPAIERWNELEPSEKKDTPLQFDGPDSDKFHLIEMPPSENRPYFDREVGKLKQFEFDKEAVNVPGDALIGNSESMSFGNALAPLQSRHNEPKTDMAFPDDANAMLAELLADARSSDFESVIIKLMREIEGLKTTQFQQKLKIDSVEQALVGYRLENQQLKNWCHELEHISSYKSDHWGVDNCNPPNFQTEKTVLIVGGFDSSSWLSDLSAYSPSQDHVLKLCPMSFPRSHASVAKLNGELFLLGGTHGKVWYDTVESYDPTCNQWAQRPHLRKQKGSLAGASLHDRIFAIGGGNGVECFSEVEVFDLNVGQWICTVPMIAKRFAPAAAEVNGAIYVAGGYDGTSYLKSAERFDPRENAWASLGSMNMRRGCHSLVAFKEKLYALGGFCGDRMVSTVEVFDLRVGSWTMEEPMNESRGYFGSFVLGGKIYALGGVKDKEVLDTVEWYEEGRGWQGTGVTAIGKRGFFCTLVL